MPRQAGEVQLMTLFLRQSRIPPVIKSYLAIIFVLRKRKKKALLRMESDMQRFLVVYWTSPELH
jgi:hypothetical protein